MESRPLISIVTPTFNRAGYLSLAIESALAQSIDNFEMLIVDDGSEDNTREVVEAFQARDPRIHYFHQANQGQSIARNRGVQEAKGEFICFLDSDNAWYPQKLERSLREFEAHPEADVVYGDYMVIDGEGVELGVNRMKRYSGFITPELLRDNFVSMNTTMTRKTCFDELGGFDPEDRLAEDYGLWLRFSTRYHFHYVPELLGYYRVMDNQISSDKARRLDANEALLQQFLERFPDVLTPAQRRRGMSHFYVRKARFECGQNRFRRAVGDFYQSLREDPLWLGPWKTLAKIMLVKLGSRSG